MPRGLTLNPKYIIFMGMSILDFFRRLGKKGAENTQIEPEIQEPVQEAEAETEPTPPEERFILCIDGGGMRGIIPVVYLQKLEKEIQNIKGNNSLDSYFDLIAGTSTGGLIALALTCPSSFGYKLCENTPQVNLDEVLDLYRTMGKEIFPSSSKSSTMIRYFTSTKYPETGIETLLENLFADSLMGQASVPTLVMSYDLFSGEPFEIRSYQERSFLVKDAGRATSAAPTYFPPLVKDGRLLVDGGVVANNPAIYAYLEAKKLYPNCTKFNILSLSTGGRNHTMTFDETNGLLNWKDQVSPMYSNAQKCTTDIVLQNMDDVNYVRIDDPLEFEIKMDDTNPSNMKKMEEFAKEVATQHESKFKEFAYDLVNAFLTKTTHTMTSPTNTESTNYKAKAPIAEPITGESSI